MTGFHELKLIWLLLQMLHQIRKIFQRGLEHLPLELFLQKWTNRQKRKIGHHFTKFVET